ncbi:methyl-accepting chemotaxis protein [Solibacillus sp. CAU 1738]|uniref:methyl-accepting chemotaxis protein n=1 Tax=Solibacillus sp. CAU 1738 TaxID=3140363 RepID=UPI00325FF29B
MKMKKSIAWKLSSLIIGVFLLLFISYSLVTNNYIHTQTVKDAENFSASNTEKVAAQLNEQFNKANNILRTTKAMFETLQAEGLLTSNEVLKVIERNIQDNPQTMGMAVILEKGVLPTNDVKNAQLVDGSGRFTPYLMRTDSGILTVKAQGLDTNGVGDWYLVPKNEMKPILQEPMEIDINGKKILVTTLAVPLVSKSGEFLGVLSTGLSMNFLGELVEKIKPDGGYASIITEDGMLIANSLKDEMNGTNMRDAIDWEPVKAALNKNKVTSLYVDSKTYEEKAYNTFAPLKIEGVPDVWSVQTVLPRSKILEPYSQIFLLTILSAIAMAVIMSTVTAWFIFRQIKPLARLQKSMEKAANGDLTEFVEQKYIKEDEIGKVTASYNHMLKETSRAISSVKEASLRLKDSSDRVHNAFEEVVASSQEVSVATEEIAQGASTQSKDAEETSERMENLADQINTLATLSGNMANLSRQTVESTEQGIHEVKMLHKHNLNANAMNEQVQKQMDALTGKISGINQVIVSIQEITAQTNLLALNASIEAARAGEHGKGFSVVADEVRKLAEQSSKETEVIKKTVQEILDETKSTVAVIERNVKSMENQSNSVTSTEQSFKSNWELTEQMNLSIKELTTNLKEMIVQKDYALLAIQNVSAVSEETAASAQQVSASSVSQQTELEQVADSTTQMNNIVNELDEIVRRFNVN